MRSSFRKEIHNNHAGYDKRDAYKCSKIQLFFKNEYWNKCCQDNSQTSPDGISETQIDRFQRKGKKVKTNSVRNDYNRTWNDLRKTVWNFQETGA